MFRCAPFLCLVPFCVLLILPAAASAQGNIYLGRVHIIPELQYTAEYNDNIYQENSNEVDDYLHHISPALFLEYNKDEQNFLHAGYNPDVIFYSDNSDNDYTAHLAELNGQYASPSGWYLRVKDTFVDTEDPYETENNYKQGIPRVRRWFNRSRLTLGYQLADRFTFQIQYGNYLKRYEEFRDQWQDREDHIYDLRVMYRILPKTSVFGEYRLSDISYPEQDDPGDNTQGISSRTSQDNTYHQVFAGLHFSPSAKINGELKLGLARKDYDNKRNWNDASYHDDWTWSAETQLNYLMSQKTTIGLTLFRATYESTDIEATSFTRTLAGLDVSHDLLPKLSLRGGLFYALEDYETDAGYPSRDDDIYTLETELTYELRDWMATGLRYTFEATDTSNQAYADEEYDNNRFFVFVRFTL